MKVPFLDLKAQYSSIKEEISEAIQEVLDSCAFAGGPFVQKFEEQFARFCGCQFAVGVGSGTDALWLILLALGVGPGDEVITVPNTFIATAEAISLCGARPVFVDVEQLTYTMDPALIERAITSRTRAIIPVHLFGQMADMDSIMALARSKGLPVIEDACQAHGAEHKGGKAGSIGIAAAFSFYPGKNLGAYGEAGAITTNDAAIADKVRSLRDHGQEKKYFHRYVGWNARMDGIQGAILSTKLAHVEEWNDRRRAHALTYHELLRNLKGLIIPREASYNRHVYHVYAIRVDRRDELLNVLKGKDINCAIHYPVPVHLQDAYRELQIGSGSLPVAEKCAGEFLSLPMYPELREDQIEYVADELEEVVRKGIVDGSREIASASSTRGLKSRQG
jgi:dTDP-4-amino-4,6-dideoxygalactose transaminase